MKSAGSTSLTNQGIDLGCGSQTGGDEVAGEDEVDEEFEAGVVQDDVDAALFFALFLRRSEHFERLGQVVDEDVLLAVLARLRALQLLDVLVAQVGQQREVRRVAPQTDLAHFGEEHLLGVFELLLRLCAFHAALLCELGDDVAVARGELEDGGARRLERRHLLAREDVIRLPLFGLLEDARHAPCYGCQQSPTSCDDCGDEDAYRYR
jgi:hypothetical protein